MFNVTASGNGTRRYQWQFNATNNLVRATNATLIVTNSQPTNAGNYSVMVTDSLGAITSAVATLTVIIPPTIAIQPTNIAIYPGQNAAFNVIVSGSEPLRYQWYFNTNTGLPRATNALLSLTNVAPGDAGSYFVVITNSAGSITSSNATLTVNPVVLNVVDETLLSNGVLRISFSSPPNLTFTVDRATNLSGPWQLGYTNLTADANGTFKLEIFADLNERSRFYRTRYP
jgi:hypothetical protein